MPRSYPAEFRCKVPDLVEAGRPVAEIADQLGVAGQTIYNCYGCQVPVPVLQTGSGSCVTHRRAQVGSVL